MISRLAIVVVVGLVVVVIGAAVVVVVVGWGLTPPVLTRSTGLQSTQYVKYSCTTVNLKKIFMYIEVTLKNKWRFIQRIIMT